MPTTNQTCLQNLNATLMDLARHDNTIVFLGEDIKAPYYGAFKAEAGLSDAFPDRVIATPISEESFTGLAAGLAMKGYKPIVDFMFSDFMTLAYDMVVNFAAKYPQMYGRDLALPMILRCANGGYRGYGATHSQSMQKFFMGIPHVSVYEMSCFHDMRQVFTHMLATNKPCIFFEEKTLYTQKMCTGGTYDLFSVSYLGKEHSWAHLTIDRQQADTAIICPGGLSPLCLAAAKEAFLEEEIGVELFIPSQLYPCQLSEILEHLRGRRRLLIVEESTEGADWGSTLLRTLNSLCAGKQAVETIQILTSQQSVIPASLALEHDVLIQKDDILNALVAR